MPSASGQGASAVQDNNKKPFELNWIPGNQVCYKIKCLFFYFGSWNPALRIWNNFKIMKVQKLNSIEYNGQLATLSKKLHNQETITSKALFGCEIGQPIMLNFPQYFPICNLAAKMINFEILLLHCKKLV